MVHVYAFRHPETEWNRLRLFQGHRDLPLNENGFRQAREMANYFRDTHFTHLVTSPLLRCTQYAAAFGEHHKGASVIVEPDFAERHVGVYEGQLYDSHPLGQRAALESPTLEGGESLDDIVARVARWPTKLASYGADAQVALFSHGMVLGVFPFVLEGKPYNPAQAVLLQNGAYHRVELDQHGKLVTCQFNLPGPQGTLGVGNR